MAYYDGTKLLSLMDINGNKPELIMCDGNRTAGKTTWFNRYLVKKFKEGKGKFILINRFSYELCEIGDKFFKDIKTLFFPTDNFSTVSKAKGIYHELYLNDKNCGYAISLNNADQIKKFSHLLCDVERGFMDEYQSETNHYCSNEINKLISVHTSLARGNGKQTKYLPFYMASNSVSLINPYYTALGISTKLKKETKFLRGDGYVLERAYVESAADALKSSAFNRAFIESKYVAYASQNIYLNDNEAFISPPMGRGNYVLTIKYQDKHFGIIEYPNDGIVYVSHKADKTFPKKISVTTEDHNINYVMLANNSFLITAYRNFFNRGCIRFSNLESKEAFLTLISY
jgi:hypothetical protein